MTPAALDHLEATLRRKLPQAELQRLGDALILRLDPTPTRLVETMTLLRDDPDLDFKLMIDLAGVHYPQRDPEFDVVYQLLSVYQNHRLRVKVGVAAMTPVPSMIPVWQCANWYEREAYDMFGILFSGHPDLRRILNDYDFEGYPLRKDFPLQGQLEMRYDNELKRVVKIPIRLERDNREYYTATPAQPPTDHHV